MVQDSILHLYTAFEGVEYHSTKERKHASHVGDKRYIYCMYSVHTYMYLSVKVEQLLNLRSVRRGGETLSEGRV